MNSERFKQYRIMWVFVYFDLPTTTKRQRKEYSTFRKQLLTDGFSMIQFSIYARHCSSRENALVHKNRVKRHLPPAGKVIVFEITDKQFGMMEYYTGRATALQPGIPQQLELF